MDTPSPDQPAPIRVPADPRQQLYLQTFRFALLLSGRRPVAKEAIREVLAAMADPVAQSRSLDRVRASLVRQVRQNVERLARCAETASQTASVEAPLELPGKVAALQEPDRSAFAAFHCFEAETDPLAESIGLRPSKFGAAVVRARRALEPSGNYPECPQLGLHRSWAKDSPSVAKAVAAVKSPETEARFAAQAAFDDRVHAEVAGISMPGIVPLPKPSGAAASGWRAAVRQPAVLAIVIAGLVVLGVGVYATMRKLDDFSGKEVVCDLVDEADDMSGLELEQIKPIEAGKLGDWFMLKGFEDFTAPPELAQVKAVGCRVYQHDGHSVAQVALDRHNALLMVFRAAETKVRLNTPAWRIFQQGDWAVAARGDGVNCYVVAFLGDSDEMVPLLKPEGN